MASQMLRRLKARSQGWVCLLLCMHTLLQLSAEQIAHYCRRLRKNLHICGPLVRGEGGAGRPAKFGRAAGAPGLAGEACEGVGARPAPTQRKQRTSRVSPDRAYAQAVFPCGRARTASSSRRTTLGHSRLGRSRAVT